MNSSDRKRRRRKAPIRTLKPKKLKLIAKVLYLATKLLCILATPILVVSFLYTIDLAEVDPKVVLTQVILVYILTAPLPPDPHTPCTLAPCMIGFVAEAPGPILDHADHAGKVRNFIPDPLGILLCGHTGSQWIWITVSYAVSCYAHMPKM